MVSVNVTVLDGRKLVSGLTQHDFEVYEDGVQQRVQFFESRSVPLDVILLIDTSSSMSDKMEVVHEAARGFLKGLRPGDRGAVVTFADTVTIAQDLTSDVGALEAKINAAQAHGSTSLRNAIYVALKQFGRSTQGTGEVRRQATAVLSDGEDTTSVVSFDDVMTLARKTGVNIYTIGLRSPYAGVRADARWPSDADYGMKKLANETGAQAFFPKTVHQLQDVYRSIAGELSAQYSIGYSPSNQRNDGRFRRILVRIVSNPAFTPRTRTGYTADAPQVSTGKSCGLPACG
jgi:VWFA-related protein